MPLTLAALALAGLHALPIPFVPAAAAEVRAGGPGLALQASARPAPAGRAPLAFAAPRVGWALRDGGLGATASGAFFGAPAQWGLAALAIELHDSVRVRVLELSGVRTSSLDIESRYVHPLELELGQAVELAPGLALFARADLTLSLWQTTVERGPGATIPPLLLCGSGSLAEAVLGAEVARLVTLSVIAGVQDDPAHLDDGANCLGGGPIWQSSRWLAGRIEMRLASGLLAGFEVGRAEHALHEKSREDEHADHGHGPHEHVLLRSVRGLESGAWLMAEL